MRVRRSPRRRMATAVAVTALAVMGCDDGSAGEQESPAATGTDDASAMPAPDEIVPSDPSGFGAYVAPGGRFTVDLPSGWGVTLMDGLAIARPEGGGPDAMIMIGSEQVDGTDTSAVLERMELDPDSDGEDVEVPGATTAQRFSGEAFAPYDLVVAVDDSGHAAAVVVFDAGDVDDEVREQVLGSVAYATTGETTPAAHA